jgi:hypothetical protein
MSLAEKIAEWIWRQSGLDLEDESWCSLMSDDAVNEINEIIKEYNKPDVRSQL